MATKWDSDRVGSLKPTFFRFSTRMCHNFSVGFNSGHLVGNETSIICIGSLSGPSKFHRRSAKYTHSPKLCSIAENKRIITIEPHPSDTFYDQFQEGNRVSIFSSNEIVKREREWIETHQPHDAVRVAEIWVDNERLFHLACERLGRYRRSNISAPSVISHLQNWYDWGG